MTNALDLVTTACQRAMDAIPDSVEGLTPEARMSLEHAIHKARTQIWRAEGQARRDWYANTRFATDPFIRHMAFIYTSGYFLVLGATWVLGVPERAHDMAVTLIGALTTTQVAICTYCFGGTTGNQRKDELLYHSTPTKDGNP
jgi:hypothetical protein